MLFRSVSQSRYIATEAKDEAGKAQDDVTDDLKDALQDEDDFLSTDSDCCDAPYLNSTSSEDFLCAYIKCAPGCKCIDGFCFNFLGLPCPFIIVKPPEGNKEGSDGGLDQEYTGSNNGGDDGGIDCDKCCADCNKGSGFNDGIDIRGTDPCNCPGCPCDTSGSGGGSSELVVRSVCEDKTACDELG